MNRRNWSRCRLLWNSKPSVLLFLKGSSFSATAQKHLLFRFCLKAEESSCLSLNNLTGFFDNEIWSQCHMRHWESPLWTLLLMLIQVSKLVVLEMLYWVEEIREIHEESLISVWLQWTGLLVSCVVINGVHLSEEKNGCYHLNIMLLDCMLECELEAK